MGSCASKPKDISSKGNAPEDDNAPVIADLPLVAPVEAHDQVPITESMTEEQIGVKEEGDEIGLSQEDDKKEPKVDEVSDNNKEESTIEKVSESLSIKEETIEEVKVNT